MLTFCALVAISYACVVFITAVCLLVDHEMKEGHALLGGIIWPFVVYRGIRNGYLTDFVKKINEATQKGEEKLTPCCGQSPVIPDGTADLSCPQCGEVLENDGKHQALD